MKSKGLRVPHFCNQSGWVVRGQGWEKGRGRGDLGAVELDEESVGDELDVLAHEAAVHADHVHGEGDREELLDRARAGEGRRAGGEEEEGGDLFNLDGLSDDLGDAVLGGLVEEVLEEEAGEVAVEALVAADELVGEGEARHEAALLEPEDGREAPGEEDALHGGEGHDPLPEARLLVPDPLEGPVRLLPHARHRLHGVEQVLTGPGTA